MYVSAFQVCATTPPPGTNPHYLLQAHATLETVFTVPILQNGWFRTMNNEYWAEFPHKEALWVFSDFRFELEGGHCCGKEPEDVRLCSLETGSGMCVHSSPLLY